MSKRDIFLAAESFMTGRGGICRVARLMARVLGEECQGGSCRAQLLALNDERANSDLDLPARTATGSRLRFTCEVQRARLRSSHFLYDSLGMSRAYAPVPVFRQPFLTWMMGIEVWEQARPDRLRAARRADVLLSISEYTRARADALHKGFAHTKVCWLGTEQDEAPDVSCQSVGPPTVLIVAQIYEDGGYKGHHELIQAWPEVVSCIPDARLVVVGTGPGLSVLQRVAAQSGVEEQMTFHGFVPEEDMDAVWREATVFAMPSRGEGFGLTYIEAMRYGIPVIASVHDAGQEINVDGETGYNVNLDISDELLERLIFLLKNSDQAAKLGQQGQRRWAEHFRYSAFRERFRPLLSDFLVSNGV
jgi:phosphatidylinositol alpha-1,6-mannosyltransferase